MTAQKNTFSLVTLLLISVAVIFGTLLVSHSRPDLFLPFFGEKNAVSMVTLVCLAGLGAFYYLHCHCRFVFLASGGFRQSALAAAVTTIPFIVVITILDLVFRFAGDIFVGYPAALAFYPAMGYIAQIALHVVPLAGGIFLYVLVFDKTGLERHLWIIIAMVSIIEAAFQAMAQQNENTHTQLSAFTFAHLYIFGFTELCLYRRLGLVCMWMFRLIYYAYWHLLWGSVRLELF